MREAEEKEKKKQRGNSKLEGREGGGKNHSAQWHPSSIMLRPIPSSVHFSTVATPRLLLG